MLNHELKFLLQVSPTIQAKCIKNISLAVILISFLMCWRSELIIDGWVEGDPNSSSWV